MHKSDTAAVRDLYAQLIRSWNSRDAAAFAAPFRADASVIGFDGSTMHGPDEIAATLGQIFAHHQTAAYIGKVRTVQLLAPTVALLRAVSGMVPPGQTALNPAVNTHHTLLAVRDADGWRIALYQNTPAQFHGRPDLVEQLTAELQQELDAQRAAE